LEILAEILAQKARKTFFGLKANIPSSDRLSVHKWLKLYNSMITPILTYGSEIWIAEHKINIDNLHSLSFEKTQNMICLRQKLILVNHIHNPWTVQSLSDGYTI
jgi:hypothetical protein